jgi:hypothetical protein
MIFSLGETYALALLVLAFGAGVIVTVLEESRILLERILSESREHA